MSGAASLLPVAPAHPLAPGLPRTESSVDPRPSYPSSPPKSKAQESLSSTKASSQPQRGSLASKDNGRLPAREEGRRAIRRRSLDLVAEANGNVEEFVREMDEKRKLLDDQIHKFIAQKEREFKRYEQEMRTKYRTPEAPKLSPTNSVASLDAQARSGHSIDTSRLEQSTDPAGGHEAQSSENVRYRVDRRTANSGLEDMRPSYEREKDFMGLFTPSFLPLIDAKPELNRSPSAPTLTEGQPLQLERSSLQRSNTEPLLDTDGNTRPGYGQRTPSSGSEGLISALKTSGAKKNPKPMRVMLQLADDQPAVHPADDLPTERGYAPVREAEAMHHSKQPEESVKVQPNACSPSPSPSPSVSPRPADFAFAHDSPVPLKRSSITQGLASQATNHISPTTSDPVLTSKLDESDDLASPFPLDEEVGQPQRSGSDWEVDYEEDVGFDHPTDISASPARSLDMGMSPRDMSPEPMALPTLSTSSLNIRSSSSSSGQPISPGFSRPSVQEDPIFIPTSSETIDDSDVIGPGSVYDAFARPSYSSRNNISGSLGESFMQRNAEQLMRRRRS